MLIGFAIYKFFLHGGIQRDLLKIANECLQRGHRVRIYTGEWRGPVPEGYELQVLDVRALSNHRRYARFHQQMTTHLQHHPVDILVGMNKMPGLDVYYAGDTCYQEKALKQRGWWYRLTPRYRHFAAVERAVFAAQSPTRILTITDVETPIYQRHYQTPDERFFGLPPGIERDRVAPPDATAVRQAFRAEFGLSEDQLLLLFVGSGFRKKGLDRVLRAIAALPETLTNRLQLFVIGSDNAVPFQRLARRFGLKDCVRFFPGRDDVPRFLFAADALVLPAYDEAAGMIILEAAFAGLPALVSANCGYAHYLQSLDAGLVTPMPFSQERFNAQLQDILTSPRREHWRAAGRAGADNPEFFLLAQRAVDHLEQFVAQKFG
jgi:UDP-glucose:(heptosyl)LPS alpha-1,3-glucosyltransferase